MTVPAPNLWELEKHMASALIDRPLQPSAVLVCRAGIDHSECSRILHYRRNGAVLGRWRIADANPYMSLEHNGGNRYTHQVEI